MKNNIVFIGMAGSGKSVIGRRVADLLSMNFIDSDSIICKKYGSLHDVVARSGEEELIRLESQELLKLQPRDTVISPGGSCVYSPEVMDYLGLVSVVTYLEVPFNKISNRLKGATKRGIIWNSKKTLREVYDERIGLYERYADIKVHLDSDDVEENARKVIRYLKKNES